jgi:hypothetical protein
MCRRRAVVWSIGSNAKQAILLLRNPKIKGAALRKVVELKTSLIVVRGGSARFGAMKYPSLNCFLCISNIHESDVLLGGGG